jgi:hypothetical protein
MDINNGWVTKNQYTWTGREAYPVGLYSSY